MADIVLRDLSFAYKKQPVFSHFNATIREGTATLVFGPSGSGKTTLLRLMLGLGTPSGGQIDGLSGKEIAAVFQEDRLAMHLTACANVALVLPKGYPREEIARQLLAVGLEESDLDKPVSEYSGGMRRRVALVRAVITGWPVIVMDEPFKGLDGQTKQQVIDYIKTQTAGKTLIIVSHDEEDADAFGADILQI